MGFGGGRVGGKEVGLGLGLGLGLVYFYCN